MIFLVESVELFLDNFSYWVRMKYKVARSTLSPYSSLRSNL